MEEERDMIEVFKHYAKCNALINAAMIKIMEDSPENAYDYAVDAYFKSIGEILDHVYKSDLTWLSGFRTVREFSVFEDPLFGDLPRYDVRKFHSLSELKEGRQRLDGVFIALTDEIEGTDLEKTVSRTTRAGQKQEKVFWKALVHVFNHQTHHRGQISQILDGMHIENDYSNMIRID
jgi:uncharacterized damage-inducible protein DinB